MANRPSHGVQERILAFLVSRPNREINQNGSIESCTAWIGKRLDEPEKVIAAEVENLAREGKVKVVHGLGNRGIKQIQAARSVEPEKWAMDELRAKQPEPDAPAFELPPDLDLRKLADSVLIAALEVLGGSDEQKAQEKARLEQIADLTEAATQLRAELSHVKIERDTNIRAKKVAEEAAREQKNRADEALTKVAELEADIEGLLAQIEDLQAQARNAVLSNDLIHDLNPSDRNAASQALLRLLEEQR